MTGSYSECLNWACFGIPHYYVNSGDEGDHELYRYCDEETCKLIDKKIGS